MQPQVSAMDVEGADLAVGAAHCFHLLQQRSKSGSTEGCVAARSAPIGKKMVVVAGPGAAAPSATSNDKTRHAALRTRCRNRPKIFLILVRRELRRNADQLLFFDRLLVFLHKAALIDPPRHARSLDRVALDLTDVQIMEAQLVQQRFLDDLMGQKIGIDADRPGQHRKHFGRMAVGEDAPSWL